MTAGLFGDGEWPGADTGCGGIPKPQDTLGFAERELSLAPAGGCACAGCTQCSHMEMCQCRVAPLMFPCHPSHTATLKATPCGAVPVCRPRGWRDNTAPSDEQAAPGVVSFLSGFWGAVFLLPCPWQPDCGTEGGTPVTLPSLPALPPAACPQPSQGHIPFSVRNKPRLVTAGDLCFVLLGAEGTQGCTQGLGLWGHGSGGEGTDTWALDL